MEKKRGGEETDMEKRALKSMIYETSSYQTLNSCASGYKKNKLVHSVTSIRHACNEANILKITHGAVIPRYLEIMPKDFLLAIHC